MSMRKKTYKFNDYSINRYSSLVAANNDSLHVDERRYSNMLRVTANGILYMGIWTFIKLCMRMLDEIRGEISEMYEPGNMVAVIIAGAVVTLLLFALFLFVDLFFRFIVWKGAQREALSGKKSNAFVVCAIVLMLYGAYAIGSFFYFLFKRSGIEGDDVIKFVFDLTSFVLLWSMLSSSFKLRKIRFKIDELNSGKREASEH